MTIPHTAIAWGAVALVAFAGKSCHDRNQRRIGALNESLRSTRAELATARRGLRALEGTHQTDTVRLARWLTRWDTVRVDSLIRLHDTIRVPIEVVRQVSVTADSTIRACTTALGSCEAIAGNLRNQLRLTERERDTYRAQIPSRVATTTKLAIALGTGYAACRWTALCPKPE
jgi:hypothetical protein